MTLASFNLERNTHANVDFLIHLKIIVYTYVQSCTFIFYMYIILQKQQKGGKLLYPHRLQVRYNILYANYIIVIIIPMFNPDYL